MDEAITNRSALMYWLEKAYKLLTVPYESLAAALFAGGKVLAGF